MCLCVLTDDNREFLETRMSTSAFLEQERKKLKKEWEELPEPKPTWEQYKRAKYRKTCEKLIASTLYTPEEEAIEKKDGTSMF